MSYGLLVTGCFAQQQSNEETFTITTYYPSPYGSYNQLEVHRSVTYKPLNKDTITDPRQGEMVYNSGDDSIYVYNGSKWVAQGAQGGYFLQCGSNCPSGTTRVGSAVNGTGIAGIVASLGYVRNQVLYQFDGNHCVCYCAAKLVVGSRDVSCGGEWKCAEDPAGRGYGPRPTDAQCSTYCESASLDMSGSGGVPISICK